MKGNAGRMIAVVLAAAVAGVVTVSAMAGTPQGAPGAAQVDAPKAQKAEGAKRTPKAPKLPEGKININSATAEQFDALPKIGPKVAARIVEYRAAHKGFKSVEELRNVKGVGPKVLEAIRPYVTL